MIPLPTDWLRSQPGCNPYADELDRLRAEVAPPAPRTVTVELPVSVARSLADSEFQPNASLTLRDACRAALDGNTMHFADHGVAGGFPHPASACTEDGAR